MPYQREPWQDWTKAEWISHQPAEEQVRLRGMAEAASDQEFSDWHLKMTLDLIKRNSQARGEGLLPPIENKPQYGNHSPSGALVSSSTDPYGRPIGAIGVGTMGPMGMPGRGPGGFGGHGGPGGFGGGHGGPGGPGPGGTR